MPLKCFDNIGNIIIGYKLTKDEWSDLCFKSRIMRHLKMTCCNTQAIPKKSKNGLMFFSHSNGCECNSGVETIHHLNLKILVAEAAINAGWDAQIEARNDDKDNMWIADVLVTKENKIYAIEIQWSPISNDKLIERELKYKKSGVNGIWLVRNPNSLSIRDDVIVARVDFFDDKYHAEFIRANGKVFNPHPGHLIGYLDPAKFITECLNENIIFGVGRIGDKCHVELSQSESICPDCDNKFNLVKNISLRGEYFTKEYSCTDYLRYKEVYKLFNASPFKIKKIGVSQVRVELVCNSCGSINLFSDTRHWKNAIFEYEIELNKYLLNLITDERIDDYWRIKSFETGLKKIDAASSRIAGTGPAADFLLN